MRVYTLSDMRSEKKLRVYTASEAKGLIKLELETSFATQNVQLYFTVYYKFISILYLQGVVLFLKIKLALCLC